MSSEFVLEMRNITKEYGSNAVLKDVTLQVRPGEIHALLGENGAGKSTLMNVLFGMPVIHETGGFKGEVLVDGQNVQIASPQQAMQQGIGMVHQEFMLIPGFTITENIKLNREIARPNPVSRVLGESLETLDRKAMAADARKALDSVGMNVDEQALVRGLPVGYMQFVEIAREIDKTGVKLLVFDEPTAVLTEAEAKQLITVMREIAASGIAIIFITHRLDEVMEACQNITILRDGRLVTARSVSEVTLAEMAELMIGRAGEGVVDAKQRPDFKSERTALKISHLAVKMPGEEVRDVSLEVREGEILGVGGLAGQGKVGISNGVMGLYPASGEVEFFGEPLPLNNAAGALRAGLSMVSEDRRGVGLLLEESIEDNIVFSAMEIHRDFQKPLLPNGREFCKKTFALILSVVLTIAFLALGFYGDTQWTAQAPAVEETVDVAAEEATLETEAAAADADAALSEDSMEDAEIEVELDNASPFIARISPLMLILGVIGALWLIYLALYPLVHGVTDRLRVKDSKAVRAYAQKMIRDLDIRCFGPLQKVGTLSGGNQQKVCVARALALKPKFLFVAEPTRGIDIGAKKLVLETLVNLNRSTGMTVVVVSSELMELRSICDRIAIVAEGKVVDILPADASDVDVGLAMSGIQPEKGGNK